jgi:hypothetical protein
LRSGSKPVALLLSLAVACGDGDPERSPAGSVVAAAGGGGGAQGVPECVVPASSQSASEVTFEFTNSGALPLFVLAECRLRYDVAACDDGYRASLPLFGDCSVDCGSPEAQSSGCVACGACVHDGVQVTSAAPLESVWSGNTYAFATTGNGCSCHHARPAAPGHYRLSVAVYGSAIAARRGAALYVVQVPFTLPVPSGRVEIPLAAASPASSP